MFVTLTILLSGLIGLLIPYLSRRFAKFMPADSATAFIMLCHFPRFPKGITLKYQMQFKKLWRQLLVISVICSLFCAGLASFLVFNASAGLAFCFLLFSLAMIFMAFIDARFQILPDVLTVPLLLFGFMGASFFGHIEVFESVAGALFGYFMPTLAGIIMFFRCPRAIGGGDIKLLSALGAWFGIIGLNVIIILSAVFFGIYALFSKKRIGPYGPFIAMASIIVMIMQFFLEIF